LLGWQKKAFKPALMVSAATDGETASQRHASYSCFHTITMIPINENGLAFSFPDEAHKLLMQRVSTWITVSQYQPRPTDMLMPSLYPQTPR